MTDVCLIRIINFSHIHKMCRKEGDQGIPEKRSEKRNMDGGGKWRWQQKTELYEDMWPVTYVILEAARRKSSLRTVAAWFTHWWWLLLVDYYVRRYGGRFISSRYGAGSGRILLDNVRCTGTETDIASCQHDGWNNHSCTHNEDVSITCFTGIITHSL